MASKRDELIRLVELYGVWDAYKVVSRTCSLPGFRDACLVRRDEYMRELARYARRFYPRMEHVDALAAANADVLRERGQLVICLN